MIREFLADNIDYIIIVWLVSSLITSVIVAGYRLDGNPNTKQDPREIVGTVILYAILSPILPVWWSIKSFFKLWKQGAL